MNVVGAETKFTQHLHVNLIDSDCTSQVVSTPYQVNCTVTLLSNQTNVHQWASSLIATRALRPLWKAWCETVPCLCAHTCVWEEGHTIACVEVCETVLEAAYTNTLSKLSWSFKSAERWDGEYRWKSYALKSDQDRWLSSIICQCRSCHHLIQTRCFKGLFWLNTAMLAAERTTSFRP